MKNEEWTPDGTVGNPDCSAVTDQRFVRPGNPHAPAFHSTV